MRCGQIRGGGRTRRVVIIVAALLGGSLLAALSVTMGGVMGGAGASSALACGSGNPVMQANTLLATLDPNTFNSGNGLPDTGGVFALSYLAGKPIAFGENLAYIQSAAPADLKMRWNFGDNTGDVEGLSPSHTYAKAGTYLVMVDYFDTTSNSWQFFDYAHITVTSATPLPNPPIATATATATSLELGTTVNFDASGSKSQDGSALTYSWDFNDGTRSSGVKATHQYVAPGKTLVELTVTDGRGVKSVTALNLVVVPVNGLPTAAVLPSATQISPGGTVSFDASQSQLPSILPNDQWVKYVWDFGDGTPQQTTTIPTTSHTYKQVGKYTVTLQAYDEQDAAGTTTVTITVGNVGSSGGGLSAGSGGANGLLIGFVVLALLALGIGGYFALQAQRRRNELIRQRQMAMQTGPRAACHHEGERSTRPTFARPTPVRRALARPTLPTQDAATRRPAQ